MNMTQYRQIIDKMDSLKDDDCKNIVKALIREDPMLFLKLHTKAVPTLLDRQMPCIIEALKSGKKINAIKLWRAATGCGLADAKQAVEDVAREQGIQ